MVVALAAIARKNTIVANARCGGHERYPLTFQPTRPLGARPQSIGPPLSRPSSGGSRAVLCFPRSHRLPRLAMESVGQERAAAAVAHDPHGTACSQRVHDLRTHQRFILDHEDHASTKPLTFHPIPQRSVLILERLRLVIGSGNGEHYQNPTVTYVSFGAT
jgi:hypothetical protein